MKGIFKNIFKGNTLYYPGCLTKFVLPDILGNYKKILERENIDFIMLKEKEFCCGSPLKNAGMEKEFEEIAKKNLALLKEHGVDRIITNCPACALVFKDDYKKILGERWEIEVKHIIEIIDPKKLATEKDLASQPVAYHDPCHLGRGLGIYQQPRDIIAKKGYALKEMSLCKNKSFCCGGGGGLKSNNPELANQIAKDRVEQAKKAGAQMLVTPCPMCYANLKENSDNLEVKEFSQI